MITQEETPTSFAVEQALISQDIIRIKVLLCTLEAHERSSRLRQSEFTQYVILARTFEDVFSGIAKDGEDLPPMPETIRRLALKVRELQATIRLMQEAGHPFFDEINTTPEAEGNDSGIPF